MQYMRIFSKKTDDYVRYWASVSTEKADKNGKGTGDYARANIPVRLSGTAAETFSEGSAKTKTKGIRQFNAKVSDFWLKAAEPKDGDPFVYVFINKMEIADEPEEDD